MSLQIKHSSCGVGACKAKILREKLGLVITAYKAPLTALRVMLVAERVGDVSSGDTKDVLGKQIIIESPESHVLGYLMLVRPRTIGDCLRHLLPCDPVQVGVEMIYDLGIEAGAGGARHDNRLEGTVRDVIFKGQFSDYFVRVANGAELVVSAPPSLPGVERGSGVTLGWSGEAADVFEATDGGP